MNHCLWDFRKGLQGIFRRKGGSFTHSNDGVTWCWCVKDTWDTVLDVPLLLLRNPPHLALKDLRSELKGVFYSSHRQFSQMGSSDPHVSWHSGPWANSSLGSCLIMEKSNSGGRPFQHWVTKGCDVCDSSLILSLSLSLASPLLWWQQLPYEEAHMAWNSGQPQSTVSEELRPSARKWILIATIWAVPSPINPSDETSASTLPCLQSCETARDGRSS